MHLVKQALLFLKKKKQKNFAPQAGACGTSAVTRHRPKGAKVFWFFFSKKNTPSLIF
jgi:hypothetical protein